MALLPQGAVQAPISMSMVFKETVDTAKELVTLKDVHRYTRPAILKFMP